MVVSASVVDPGDHMAAWEPWLLPSVTREYHLHITSLGKGPNSKWEVQFLLNVCPFHTILKLRKGPKSGTICICPPPSYPF